MSSFPYSVLKTYRAGVLFRKQSPLYKVSVGALESGWAAFQEGLIGKEGECVIYLLSFGTKNPL